MKLRKNSKRITKKLVEVLRLPKIVVRTVYGDQSEFDDINDPELSEVVERLVFRQTSFTIYLEYCQYKNGRIVYDGRSRYDLSKLGKEDDETGNAG